MTLAATPSYADHTFSQRTHKSAVTILAIVGAAVAIVVVGVHLIRDKSESSELSDESLDLNKLPLNMKIELSYFDQGSDRGDSRKTFTPMLRLKLHF